MAEKCPQCGSNSPTYPMLINVRNPRTLCADEFHREFLRLTRPTLGMVLLYWWRNKVRDI